MTKPSTAFVAAAVAAFAAVPASASIISGVSTNDADGSYTRTLNLTDRAGAYTDSGSSTTWTDVPSSLEGAQYVQTFQGDNSNSDLEVFLSFSGTGSLFVFHDDGLNRPDWLTTDFTDTDGNISQSDGNSGTFSFSVFSREVTGDSLTLFDNDPGTTNNGQMYGIAATASGDDDGPSPIPAPASLLLLGSALFGGGLFARRRRQA